ncbi:MAG: type II secretion system F family protein [Rickettsiales bacterium]|nr:type II secretion system F family protein [Rickettsiales bacterium]
MKIFNWEGFEGNLPRNGIVEADSQEKAIQMISKQGIIVTQISQVETEADEKSEEKPVKYKAKAIKNKDKIIFTKKLVTMVKSGLPILKTLKMLEEQAENKHLRVVANKIRTDVEAGTTLSDAFAEHNEVFDQVYINLLKAGESSGKLTIFLEKLVQHLAKIENIRKKVRGALMYPIIVFCVAIIVIIIMLVKVVPVFQAMFQSMGNELPGPTQFIVNVSEFVRDPSGGGVLVAILIGVVFVLRNFRKKNFEFRRKTDQLFLKIPLLGDVIIKSTLSKIAMISANLSAAGVSVIETFNIISKSISNIIFLEAFDGIKKGVTEGKSLSQLYSSYEIFPPTFHQMISIGEETGRLDEMLTAVANYYEEEFDMLVDKMTELLEPIMIVFMGVTVGFIIIAMYMPIFQIGKAVQGG